MKKLLLVLLICVVIDCGKEVYKAVRIIFTEEADFALTFSNQESIRSDKQIVFNILLLSDERHCP